MSDDRLTEERAETRRIALHVNAVALIFPVVALGLVWAGAHYSGYALTKKDWRLAFVLVWIATLGVIARAALAGFFAFRRTRRNRRGLALVDYRPGRVHSVARWEARRSRKLIHEFMIAGFVVPVVSSTLAWGYFQALGVILSHSQITALIAGSLLLTILHLALRAHAARRSRTLFSVPDLQDD